jgi:hypothetical protein
MNEVPQWALEIWLHFFMVNKLSSDQGGLQDYISETGISGMIFGSEDLINISQ